MWDEERVDAAIDETARRMTAGEPGGDFRARVMRRIEAGSRGGLFAFRSWRPAFLARGRRLAVQAAAGLSLAALVLFAIVVSRAPKGTEDPARQLNPVANAAPPTPDTIASNSGAPAGVRLPPSPHGGSGVPGKPDPTSENTRASASNGMPSRPADVDRVVLPSIDLEPIAVAALPTGESIHVEPLPAAASIAVAPLSTDIEGDPR